MTEIDADAFNAWEAQGWESRAEAYHHYFSPLTSRMAQPLLDAAGVGPGCRLLDVACGPGHVAAIGASRGAIATGIDVAEAMVQLAGRLYPDVRCLRANAEDLPFGDGSFDAVAGNLAILHFGRPSRAVAEFARVLVPGGTLALSTWDTPAVGRLPGIFFEAIQAANASVPVTIPAGPPFFRFADEMEFTNLLREAGLHDVSVDTIAFTHSFPGTREVWDWLLKGTVRAGVMVSGQPPEIQARVYAELERLAAEYHQNDVLTLPVSLKIAHGRR